MLRIDSLTTDHGQVRAVDHVSFDVAVGSCTAVIGANGAGKSSLLRTLSGLVKSSSGSAHWGDIDLLKLPTSEIVRHGVAHVPEGRSVIAELSVEENLTLGALWRGKDPDVAVTKNEVLDLFPRLGERLKQGADSLSGGERQMLAIGRALMARPQLLLLDEPSLGLAPIVIEQIFHTIDMMRKATGLTVVLVEQNAVSALGIANHAVVLSLGKIVVSGSATDIASDESLRHAYLGY